MNKKNELNFKTKKDTIKITMILKDNIEDYTESHEVVVNDEDMELFKSLGNDNDMRLKQFISFIYEYQFNKVKSQLRRSEGCYKRALTYLANHADLKPDKREKYILKATDNKRAAIELENILDEYRFLIRQLYLKYSEFGLIEINESKLNKIIEQRNEELLFYRNQLEELKIKKEKLTCM